MRVSPSSLGFGGGLLLTATAWAQVPAGPVFRVNTYTTGDQGYPHAAMRAQGDFVVAWTHRPQYGEPPDVHARRFGADAVPIGDEFRVNDYTTTAQSVNVSGQVGIDARGNFIVPWDDFRTGSDPFARRFSASGQPRGGDFQVNQPTPGLQLSPTIAAGRDGRFVVVWEDYVSFDVFARRFSPFGAPLGGDFRVNTYTTNRQTRSNVASDAAGNFTVIWDSYAQEDPIFMDVYGQRYDASGAPLGGEFRVNAYTTLHQSSAAIAMNADGASVVAGHTQGPGQTKLWGRRFTSAGAPVGGDFTLVAVPVGDDAVDASVAMDEAGNFAVAWSHYPAGPSPYSLTKVRRFAADGTPRGAELQLAAPQTYYPFPQVASDAVGNFVVIWHDLGASEHEVFGRFSEREVFGRRFGGLFPEGLAFADGANGVLEVKDTFGLITTWRNRTGAAQIFASDAASVVAPSGLTLSLSSGANYGTVADGAVGVCTPNCIGGSLSGTRPAGHVDLTFVETIEPDEQGQAKRWRLHVGESFTDVPRGSGFYRFIETLLHRAVTAGCGATTFCPAGLTTREQMAVFLLAAKEGEGFAPPPCGVPLFPDVPAGSPFCPWIEELARRGVTSGCSGGNYCPGDFVTREQMAVFVLRTVDPSLNPPACGVPAFLDVPAASPFCRWIEELARRGVVNGCGGGSYCPQAPVTREQMSVFLSLSFGLTLYGS